jgi:hypothetical protein
MQIRQSCNIPIFFFCRFLFDILGESYCHSRLTMREIDVRTVLILRSESLLVKKYICRDNNMLHSLPDSLLFRLLLLEIAWLS